MQRYWLDGMLFGSRYKQSRQKETKGNNRHHTLEKKKKTNKKKKKDAASGDFDEGGVGTDMAEERREILRKLRERESIEKKTTGKATVQREKGEGTERK